MVVSVRVKLVGGDHPPETAYTLNASESGVKLAGYRANLSPKTSLKFSMVPGGHCSGWSAFRHSQTGLRSTLVRLALTLTRTFGESNFRSSRMNMKKKSYEASRNPLEP
jgi:hypothetical protein